MAFVSENKDERNIDLWDVKPMIEIKNIGVNGGYWITLNQPIFRLEPYFEGTPRNEACVEVLIEEETHRIAFRINENTGALINRRGRKDVRSSAPFLRDGKFAVQYDKDLKAWVAQIDKKHPFADSIVQQSA